MSPLARPLGLLLVLAVLLCPAVAGAQAPVAEQSFSVNFASWQQMLQGVEDKVHQPDLSSAEEALLRRQTEYVLGEARTAVETARAESVSIKELLDALGPPPEEGQPPETEEVASQREELSAALAAVQGREKQAVVTVVRAENVLKDFAAERKTRWLDHLVRRGPSPLLPSVWAVAIPEFLKLQSLFVTAPIDWWRSVDVSERLYASFSTVAAAVVLSIIAGWPLRLWLLRRFGRNPAIAEPTYGRRLLAAVVQGLAGGLLAALALAAVAVVMVSTGLVSGLFAELLIAVVGNLVLFVVVGATTQAVLAPDDTAWRVTPFNDESSRILSRWLTAVIGLFAAANILAAPGEAVRVSDELDSLYTFEAATLGAVLIVGLLRRKAWQWQAATPPAEAPGQAEAAAPPAAGRFWGRLRVLAILVAVAAPVAGAFGYTNLSEYLIVNLVISGLALAGLLLFRALTHELVTLLLERDTDRASRVFRLLDVSAQTGRTVRLLLLGVFDIALFVAGALFGLSIWGMPPEEILQWLGGAMTGISIGSYTFSVTDLLLAILVFAIVMIVTRSLQWVLEERILPQTRFDTGVRHSIKTAVGYVGLFIAIALGISTLGLDLSNIALVAGALSVGIGFGLQNVVSNFVSGLILLVERPIKAGDWVVVGDQEGYVKRINVRATEITTFQRASVIVPNSEILSNALTNWTHKDLQGRVEVAVGVDYGSDVEQVRDILLECGRAHPEAQRYPAPDVLFTDFGASSLDFELRVFIRHIENRLRVKSDLRFAIRKAFQEHGIGIPFPQRVLHFAPGEEPAAEPVRVATNNHWRTRQLRRQRWLGRSRNGP